MRKLLFYISVATLSLGQFSAIFKDEGVNIYLSDLFVGLFALTGLIGFLLKKKLAIPKYFLGFLAFLGIALISLLVKIPQFESAQILISSFYLIRFALYIFSGIVIFNMLAETSITKEELTKAFMFSALFLAIAGFIQLLVLPDFTRISEEFGWDPHKNRLASTFFDPNFVGGYLAICLALLFEPVSAAKKTKALAPLTPLVSVTILSAIFLTFSRSAWAETALIILIYGINRSKKLLLIAVLILFLAYAAIPRVQSRLTGITDPADSAHFRLISWQNTWEIAKDNLFLGVGFNTFRYAQKNYGIFETGTLGGNSGAGSDSSLLLVLATTGLVGFTFFLFSFLYPLLSAIKLRDITVIAVIVSLLFQSQFINAIFYPQIMFLWITILAIFSYSSSRN